ncbi:xanthine dehydrogenase family protein molybdopterin-binding subunit [Pseudomonas mangiferae]|uniref:Xanthine dehydrogenase family protein molybdopterin-binding subunit n=1 Tax=Pseudomonas mangiferae TaxID=2593654 RepID=A0A553GXJ1_9PSED|nr:xanthine dehydrogenase family protein molybdopterin-binding subunit [Pseudomonas mangiferae]TRX74221.1 xanthine dehydrogenase family protein molybdopterin-binding subunit [Pseudomonas mangiferae]
MTAHIGKPLDRVDGPLKVTGQAQYAGEFAVPGLTYGVAVNSTLAKGRILALDVDAAKAVPGVVDVLSHLNRPRMAAYDESYTDMDSADGAPFRPLFNDRVLYSGQPLALVVAETFEAARYAATLVGVRYAQEPHQTDIHRQAPHDAPAELPKPRGDADEAFARAAVKVEAAYSSPVEHHNPMEPHASTVVYQPDGGLTIYDKTQSAVNTLEFVSHIFGLADGDARVLSPFVGGAFGSGLRPQYQVVLAVMAALHLKRSVRVTLTRQQMFTFGHRPQTLQRLKLGADQKGHLEAVIHEVLGETSRFEDFTEHVAEWSGALYHCDNVRLAYQLAALDVYTPLDMRAPGAVLGIYALECALDELAVATGVDPVQLRIDNFSPVNQNEGKPYSSKQLLACYQQGAERFGWSQRNPQPRSMREGHQLIGWGMASGAWEAMLMPASAKATLAIDGSLVVASATADIGTGTYTVMTQIAGETLGLPMDKVTFKLGDTSLPKAPLEGGSFTVSSVGTAVQQACQALIKTLLETAQKDDDSPLAGATPDDVECVDGCLRLKADPARSLTFTDIVRQSGSPSLEAQADAKPEAERDKYATGSHAAVFVEVKVDEALGTVQVSRVVSAIAAGRVVNPKTAENQILGGVVWGIGMALQEETQLDHHLGRFMNHSLAEYHIPVQADIQDLQVIFVEEHDRIVNPLGSKGVGEIGIVGVAAAIANAVYHATGKRVRDLPITLDKLL